MMQKKVAEILTIQAMKLQALLTIQTMKLQALLTPLPQNQMILMFMHWYSCYPCIGACVFFAYNTFPKNKKQTNEKQDQPPKQSHMH